MQTANVQEVNWPLVVHAWL